VKKRALTYISLSVLLILLSSSCASTSIYSEFEFANTVAKNELWKEAKMRWENLIPKMGKSPKLHNNLAVAYERLGEFEKAEKEYKTALKLSPNNKFIKDNYDRFEKKRSKKNEKKSE